MEMSKVTYDENGEIVDYLAERNKEIIAELEPVLREFIEKEKEDKKGKKRYGFMFSMQIDDTMSKYGWKTAQEFCNLDADDIEYAWWKYHSLMAYFNRFFEIVPNRQGFCVYFGINIRMYNDLLESDDEKIRSVMDFIENAIIHKGWGASEYGNANDKAVMGRLRAKGVGHGVVSASEEMAVQAAEKYNEGELLRELQKVAGKKYLG